MSGVVGIARNTYLAVTGRPSKWRPGPKQPIRGHKDVVREVAFFKDGQRVVTGSDDHTLRIWDVQKGALSMVAGPFEEHTDRVQSVTVSADDRLIASGGCDKTIIIWDVESRQKVFNPLVGHTDWVRSVSFSPNGKKLASGSNDKTVIIWDVETGRLLETLKGHYDWVSSVAFSPDGLTVASGSMDRTIRIWRTDNAELFLQINVHQLVTNIAWSPDGQQLVSASYDKTAKFWDSSTGLQIDEPSAGHTGHVFSVAFSLDGSFIATASHDKTVRLWNTKTHQQIGWSLEHPSRVVCLAISPNGELLVDGSEDGKVRLWSIKKIIEHEQHQFLTDATVIDRRSSLYDVPVASNSNSQSHLPTPRMQDFTRTDTELGNHDVNGELSDNNDVAKHDSSVTHEPSGSKDDHSVFNILAIDAEVLRACIAGDLPTAEGLLTRQIETDFGDCDAYANRSIIMAQFRKWDHALQDAVKSIAIQPSFLGYISKGIALCGKEQLSDAMEAFDLGFLFSKADPMVVNLLLLIKAIALFNASQHNEALRRVRDLATAYQHADALLCTIAHSYLYGRLGIIAFEGGQYSISVDQLTESITSMADLILQGTIFEPRLKIFTVLFGWDLDSLWQNANRTRCYAMLREGRVIEAIESLQYTMEIADTVAKSSCLEWSTAFKHDCTVRCVAKADEAVAANDYEEADKLYSAAIGLDSSCDSSLFAQRSRVKLGRNMYMEALEDSEKVIQLNPSSYLGFKLKYDALDGAQRYDEAIEAFKIMLTKLATDSDEQIRNLRKQYVSPSEAEDAIRRAMQIQLDNTPHRLLNTFAGRLCDRDDQIKAFRTSTEYKELLASMIKCADIRTEFIRDVVGAYFRFVMLSHRWEGTEPLLRDVQGQLVYELNTAGGIVKLQSFCKTARDAGYLWAWIDTCCIDQSNNVEVQESVNSMFVWYRHSALTIVYLSDVPPSSKPGALAESVWNTRGWTIQEFLAPRVVLFYQQDWTPYLDDRSPNHKESTTIMQELADRTGIDTQTLVAFRPGMREARKKLQWVSRRVTTRQEDIAYSLFGIFGIHLPVIYGERKQNALGRLLQEIVAQSGDITALDWVGTPSNFNSCLPAEITSYTALSRTFPSPSGDDMQALISSLRNTVIIDLAFKLYTLLDNLTAPRFANRRLQLPSIVFVVTEVTKRHIQDQESYFTYDVKADGLQDLSITTEDKMIQFSPTMPIQQTFLLVRPWNRYDLGLPDFADDTLSVEGRSAPGSLGEITPVVSDESESRALRLVVRLTQPFAALLVAQQRGGEYKRIAADQEIVVQVKDETSVRSMMDVRTLEIL